MATKTRIKRLESRREYYEGVLDNLREYLIKVTQDDIQSYTIGSRTISKDKKIDSILKNIQEVEETIDELDAELETAGRGGRRKAVGVVPMDW